MASAAVFALERELGVSGALAQVLVRRGLGDAAAARAWLAADERHEPAAFAGIDAAVALICGHVDAGTAITVHGDYDVDGVCSTAILVRALRGLGGNVDWFLPSRSEDGYGLSVATVERLAARGTGLLITADCGITAVDEVAAARAAGLDVVVTDHHSPRSDGALPAAPIVHPAVCGYPCPDLCAGGVAYKLAAALAGEEEAGADLDLVALATVADCVPLRGENRRLVRAGLRALATTGKPGLRALMRVAEVDPSRIDARAIGFRLAPRINAAGRLYRADAGLELLLTEDDERALQIAQELDRANAERRHAETRILFEAEAQVAQQGERIAYVLAGDDWHPGVIGIVASRIAERHHRPAVLIALSGDEGTGSGRSIPAFDLLAGLDAAAGHLIRHGGHRAAAGCTIRRADVEAFRAAFTAHAESVLGQADLVPVERVDAVVAGDELGEPLAAELEQLAPFGIGNPGVALLVPAARLADARPMGEGKHMRFSVEAGGVRARAVAFGTARLPDADVFDATFTLELNEYNGAVEPRLVLRHATPAEPGAVTLVGEPEPGSDEWVDAVLRAPAAVTEGSDPSVTRDRRGGGIAGTIAALVHTGEPVLVVTADAFARREHLRGRLGGFALTSWGALERTPALADDFKHVVALDPPLHPAQHGLLERLGTGRAAHLAWGDPELPFAHAVLQRQHAPRPALAAFYRALREGGLRAVRHPAWLAAQLLSVLAELGLCDPSGQLVDGAGRQDLERSPAFRALAARHAEGLAWLSSGARRAAA